jgi:hypothetical protein
MDEYVIRSGFRLRLIEGAFVCISGFIPEKHRSDDPLVLKL